MAKLTTISLGEELRSKIDKYNESNSEKIEVSKLSRWAINLFLASNGKFDAIKFDDVIKKLKNNVELCENHNDENDLRILLNDTIEDLQDFLNLLGIERKYESEEMNKMDKNSSKYWYDKGIILQSQNRMEDALDAYNKAIDIEPDNEYAWYNKGHVLEDLMEYDDALDAHIEVTRINPKNIDAWYSQAYIDLCEYENFDGAIRALNHALKINPNHVPSLDKMGVAYSELGKIEEAIASFAKIMFIDPNNDFAKYELTDLLGQISDMPDALDIYDRLLGTIPDNVDILAFKARLFYHKQQNKEQNSKTALEIYDKILKLDDKNKEARSFKENIVHNFSLHDNAENILNELLESYPNDEIILEKQALFFKRTGKFKKSLEIIDKLLEISPNHNIIKYKQSILEELPFTTKKEMALEIYDRLLNKNQDDILVLKAKARVLYDSLDERALEVYDRLLNIEPANQDLKREQTWLLHIKNNGSFRK